jgi:hypothetical protein
MRRSKYFTFSWARLDLLGWLLGWSLCQCWLPLIGRASFHLGKLNAEAVNSSSQTVGVFEGSVVVGGLEGASVGGASVGVGGGSSAGGAMGLGAGRGAFFRFIVFLLTSSLSSWATFHPPTDYRILQIRL